MPVEWNILMVYGGFFLFGFHPDASVLALGSLPLLVWRALLFVCLFAIPLLGNFFPSRVSFLMAMRYYAGNWAYNIWLFRGDSSKKLDKPGEGRGHHARAARRDAGRRGQQLETAMMMSPSARFMHLEGRVLLEALPRAVDDIEEYEWMDGEIVGGLVLGWNFGDGHLNELRLLEAVQAQCGFEEG